MHPIQQRLLKLAVTYNLGDMPLRKIGEIIEESNPLHPQIIKYHLEQLEKRGLITWNKEKKKITKREMGVSSNNDFIVIPILGSANCGDAARFADEHLEGHIKVSTKLLKNKTGLFAIKAVGASMNQANIHGKSIDDGDFVIVDSSDKNIRTNDYVLSIIDDRANIKKISVDNQHHQITLFSESSYNYPPIYLHGSELSKYLVNGKVVQVIKKFKN